MSETWDKLVPGGGSPGTGRPPRTELQDLRRPAAQQLAELVRLPFGQGVRLPPAFARAAVERFFMSKFRYKVAVIEGPCGPEQTGRPLAEGEWALLIPELFRSSVRPLVGGSPVHTLTGRVHVYPRHAVQLEPRYVRWLLVALEKVKPEELDAEGLPYPWVPPTARTERLGGGDPDEADVEIVPAAAALPPLEPAVPVTTPPTFPDERIRAWFDELSRLAGFPGLALHLVRGADNKLGFTAGRIWLDRRLGPLRVRLVTCPNADPAEIQSTIVHELGHALSRGPGHSEAFKLAMIGLAARRWGDRWFAEAQAQAGERYALVDRWVACGIRAAERTEGVPPALRDTADEQLLRVVTRIRRLRELAADQQGLPEAIAATAMANDLVVLHGLSQHGVRVAAVDEDQLCDRWILIKGDGVWRRDLAHWVARACNVFSLATVGKSRMHFFGRYADVVQAEYLHGITAERIERECDRHLARWRQQRDRIGPGGAARERVSFCDSAVRAFRVKLDLILQEERGDGVGSPGSAGTGRTRALDAATDFAGREFRKRGLAWGSGSRRNTRDNAAGRALGRSLEVVRGVGAGAGAGDGGDAPKLLPSRRT